MEISKITSKGQVTIPAAFRKALGMSPGDRIAFALEGNKLMVRKALPLDAAYYASVQDALATEWSSDPDCEAFDDL